MIKFIASDLDGTLLLPNGELPAETFTLIENLHARGVLFCVASGRQYESLKRLFAPVADKIVFIAENGALVFYKGERVFCENLPPDALDAALHIIRQEENVYPLLCCENNAYVENDYAPFYNECKKYYPNFKTLPRLEDCPELDSVCKIAVFDERGAAVHSGKSLPKKLPDLRVIVSGKVWSDVSMPTVNKGNALVFTQKHFSLKKEECAAFGDYMNDLEMLLSCGRAFVTENGYPALKERIASVIPSNAEMGVIGKIKELLEE